VTLEEMVTLLEDHDGLLAARRRWVGPLGGLRKFVRLVRVPAGPVPRLIPIPRLFRGSPVHDPAGPGADLCDREAAAADWMVF
jgi:hypothetical protein